ncbi:MAG: hypothetical protein RJA70_2171 [Pseudomonadota bacterium]
MSARGALGSDSTTLVVVSHGWDVELLRVIFWEPVPDLAGRRAGAFIALKSPACAQECVDCRAKTRQKSQIQATRAFWEAATETEVLLALSWAARRCLRGRHLGLVPQRAGAPSPPFLFGLALARLNGLLLRRLRRRRSVCLDGGRNGRSATRLAPRGRQEVVERRDNKQREEGCTE